MTQKNKMPDEIWATTSIHNKIRGHWVLESHLRVKGYDYELYKSFPYIEKNYIPKSKVEMIYHKVADMYNDQRNNNQCVRMNVTRKVMDMLEDVLGFSDEDYDGTTYLSTEDE